MAEICKCSDPLRHEQITEVVQFSHSMLVLNSGVSECMRAVLCMRTQALKVALCLVPRVTINGWWATEETLKGSSSLNGWTLQT